MTDTRRILVVDDEMGMRAALAEVLTRGGFAVDVAGTGEDALARLEKGGVDLLVTDLRLPGMSGLEFARKLRRGRRAQPVIVVTAYGSAESAADLRRAGIADVFPKPFHIDALRRSVRRALIEFDGRRRSSLRKVA